MLIGFSKIEITPDFGCDLGGYEKRTAKAEKLHTELFCRSLVGQEAGQDFVIISLDLLGIDRDLYDRIVAEAGSLYQIRKERISIIASHTHSAPDGIPQSLNKGIWTYDKSHVPYAYKESLVSNILYAIYSAKQSQVEATLQWYKSTCIEVASNRRRLDMPVDTDVFYLEATDINKKVLGGMLHFACHPTVIGPYEWISSDFSGAAVAFIEKQFQNSIFLYMNGAAGDISTRWNRTNDQPSEAERMGAMLFSSLSQKVLLQTPTCSAQMYTSSLSPFTFKDRFTMQAIPTVFQTVQLKGITMMLVPGELFSSYALSNKRLQPSSIIVGYANDYIGYIPDMASLQEGGYEVEVCRINLNEMKWIDHWLTSSERRR